jgi:hypothetical protein
MPGGGRTDRGPATSARVASRHLQAVGRTAAAGAAGLRHVASAAAALRHIASAAAAPRQIASAAVAMALAGAAFLASATAAMALDPTASPAGGGDVRTNPAAPGLTGDPLFAALGVAFVGLVAVAVTLAAVRLTTRR